jgi:hypothetical protein
METTVLGMKDAAKQQQIFWMPKKKEGHLRRTENDVTRDWGANCENAAVMPAG